MKRTIILKPELGEYFDHDLGRKVRVVEIRYEWCRWSYTVMIVFADAPAINGQEWVSRFLDGRYERLPSLRQSDA